MPPAYLVPPTLLAVEPAAPAVVVTPEAPPAATKVDPFTNQVLAVGAVPEPVVPPPTPI